jgi:hypothetical protein
MGCDACYIDGQISVMNGLARSGIPGGFERKIPY